MRTRLTAQDWIEAGFQALVEHGPAALKAEPLARRLGTTKGSFYWHFKDISAFHAAMLADWHRRALEAIAEATARAGPPAEQLFRLGQRASSEPERYGGHAAEPAIRAWALSNHTVADVVAEIDRKRLDDLASLLAELGLTNPELPRIVYGAYIGMGTLNARDGTDTDGAMSTLMAAIFALQDA